MVGLMMPAGFMVYGFVLIYLRDFGPGKEKWIVDYDVGKPEGGRLDRDQLVPSNRFVENCTTQRLWPIQFFSGS